MQKLPRQKCNIDLDTTKDKLNGAQTQAKSADQVRDILKDAANKLAETQASLQSTEQRFRTAQQAADAAKSKGSAATSAMADIAEWIPGAIEELRASQYYGNWTTLQRRVRWRPNNRRGRPFCNFQGSRRRHR